MASFASSAWLSSPAAVLEFSPVIANDMNIHISLSLSGSLRSCTFRLLAIVVIIVVIRIIILLIVIVIVAFSRSIITLTMTSPSPSLAGSGAFTSTPQLAFRAQVNAAHRVARCILGLLAALFRLGELMPCGRYKIEGSRS